MKQTPNIVRKKKCFDCRLLNYIFSGVLLFFTMNRSEFEQLLQQKMCSELLACSSLACSFILSSSGLVHLRPHKPQAKGCFANCCFANRCIAAMSLAVDLVFTWSSGGLGHGVKWAAKEAFCWVSSISGPGNVREGVRGSSRGASCCWSV